MKKIVLLIVFFLVYGLQAQEKKSYIDSLKLSIKKLSVKEQLKIINDIPYGNYVAEVENSEKLFKMGETLAIKSNDSIALGEIIFKLGQLKHYQNKLDEGTALFLKAIKIFETKKDFVKEGIAYGGLGYSLKRNDIESSLKYMRKGIKLLEKANDLEGLNPIYDNYGVVLNIVQKNDSALVYQKRSLAIKKKLKDSIGLGYSYANIANTFAEKKSFNLAKIYVDSSSIIRNKMADNYGITVNYVQKAEIFVLERKWKEALENFKVCAQLANKYKYKHLEQYCYENIAKTYLELKDYKNAYTYDKRFQVLKDSTDNLLTTNKIEELKIQFETEKKEKLLSEAKTENLIKESKIRQKNYIILGAFGLAFLLGLIGYLMFKQQKLKNIQLVKENELRQALSKIETQNKLQEQRIEISRDLHDNIGSQLTFIISSIDNLKFFNLSREDFNKKYDTISSFTRKTITELRDSIWAMNKEEITFEDLKTRTTNFIENAKISLQGIQFEFNYPKEQEDVTLNSITGITLYRIIQEGVNNAIKHAKANKIVVTIDVNSERIILKISDNGNGFDYKTTEKGNGINSLEKRAKEINGTIEFVNQNGMQVIVEVPKK